MFTTQSKLAFAAVAALSFTALAHAVPLLEARDSISVMVVGDSISQGYNADYTWRYRLWQWFEANDVAVDFVGPYVGTVAQPEGAAPALPLLQGETAAASPPSTDGAYAENLSFNSNHFAVWGRQLIEDVSLIQEMVATYAPDFLLVELGFNDIGWGISNAPTTIQSMESFIANARAANPNLNFAIANIPQRTSLGTANPDLSEKTTDYNSLLAIAIPSWSTAESPIALVDFAGNYDCGPDACLAGHDGLHPNVMGEYQIAQAFSSTLYSSYGLGSGILEVPSTFPVRPCTTPANFNVVSAASGIVATWDHVFGAYGYYAMSEIAGSADWGGTAATQGSNRLDTTWTVAGIEWEYQIQASCGNDPSGNALLSDTTTVLSAVADPSTAPGPTNIVVQATVNGMNVYWDPPAGDYDIIEYEVIMYDVDQPGGFISGGVGIEGTAISFGSDLDPLAAAGRRVETWISTWTSVGGGLPTSGNAVTIGYGIPEPPTDLAISSIDGVTVQLNYEGDYASAGYSFWTRNVNNATDYSRIGGGSMTTCGEIGWLYPGVWNYEFCVTAFNGYLESAQSTCVIASDTYVDVSACPALVQRGNATDDGGGRSKLSSSTGIACVAGTGDAPYTGLCMFTCSYDLCPEPCTCTANGPQPTAPSTTDNSQVIGAAISGEPSIINTLCQFACSMQYCPTEACVETAATTPSSSLFPLQNPMCTDGSPPAGYAPWPCITCTNAGVATTVDALSRWMNADTDDCLADIVSWFEIGESGGAVWPVYGLNNVVGQWAAYFNITHTSIEPAARNCFLDSETCTQLNICDANVPAGSLIFDAFSNLQHLYESMYNGMNDAGGAIGDQIGTLSDVFATVTTEDDTIVNILIDIVTIGYGQFAAALWNKVLKDAAFFTANAARKNDHGWYKDASNNMVSTGITIAKSEAQAAQVRINQEADLGTDLGILVGQFQNFVNQHLELLFNGTESGITDLQTMLTGGAFADQTDQDVSQATLQPLLEEVVLSMLIPQAWALSTNVYPVVLAQPGTNNLTNPFEGVYYGNPGLRDAGNKQGANLWGLSDTEADNLRISIGGYTLYMFSVRPDASDPPESAALLPGTAYLTGGNSTWANLNISDMAVSSFQGWQLNNYQQGYKIDPTGLDSLLLIDGVGTLGEFAFQNAFATPGYYTFPVCTVEEIVYNAWHLNDVECDTFPCCGITAKEAYEVDTDTFPSR